MNGVYSGVFCCVVWMIEWCDGLWLLLEKKKVFLFFKDVYYLVQNFRKNKVVLVLVCLIFLLKDVKGNLVNNVCLFQYYVSNKDGCVEDLEIQKYGNS